MRLPWAKVQGQHPEAQSQKRMLIRMVILKLGFLLFFLVILLRLVQIQVLNAPYYQEIARRQHEATVKLPATRGGIYDRSGILLVSNTMFVSFGADPKLVGKRADDIAGRFAMVFDKSKSLYLTKLLDGERRFVWMERRVRPEYSRRIKAASFEGMVELQEPRRLYHYDHVAGQLIGFTDIDNNGLDGIELQMHDQLRGIDGHVIMARDALGRKRPQMDYPRVDPVNGNSVLLTIDLEVQSIAEEELRKGVERTKAEGGLAVVLDPGTGEILAMANHPSLNPNDVSRVEVSQRKNRVITDMFEPGSVFKIVTASAALHHRLVKPEESFYGERGRYVVRGRKNPITDIHPYGTLTFRQAVEQSSNIILAKISNRVGAEALYTTARNYGFGIKTGIELPGEVQGELKKPSEWSGTTLNTMAYGYEVGVTPLQLAVAYAAVANKGVMMKPFVVQKVVDEHQEVVLEHHPQVVRKVISPETAATVTSFLEGVVERGTGVSAKIPGLRIAGKTGTSRKFVGGKYELGRYTASFVGFFPAEDPKAVCLVMLDNPSAGGYTGGIASAPIFKGIAQRMYAMSGRFVSKTAFVSADRHPCVVPDVTNMTADAARTTLAAQGYEVAVQGTGLLVQEQRPGPGAGLPPGGSVTLVVVKERSALLPGYVVVPNLHGLSMRRAVNRLVVNQLDAVLQGSGVVILQSPAAGQHVKIGTRVSVRCEPRLLVQG